MQVEYSEKQIVDMAPELHKQSNGRSPALARLGMTAALACAVSMLGAAGCASAQPYNPGSLPSGQLSRVADICQSTVGLSPSEPPRPVWGAATNPDLSGGENYYQGCVASLSDYQQAVNQGFTAVAADRDCRAQGYASATPALAECVLRTERTAPPSDRLAGPTPVSESASPGSYYSASHRDQNRRIETACAQLGLNPAYSAFASCVKNMKDTFYSIDNPRG
jgi:hypothetical protein